MNMKQLILVLGLVFSLAIGTASIAQDVKTDAAKVEKKECHKKKTCCKKSGEKASCDKSKKECKKGEKSSCKKSADAKSCKKAKKECPSKANKKACNKTKSACTRATK